MPGWQDQIVARPDGGSGAANADAVWRLAVAARAARAYAAGGKREAETLLADTVQLVQARTDADISSFCDELSQRRRAVDPPSAEHRSAPP